MSKQLPANLSLAMILHFVPKMKAWIVPPPTAMPPPIKRFALRKPFVGINIPEHIDKDALLFIINRLLQLSGRIVGPDQFNPNLILSVAINVVRAWQLLELPKEGIEGLETHILMRLMLGSAVSLAEMKALWNTYSTTSNILIETARNFIREHIEVGYSDKDYAKIWKWIGSNNERKKFFAQFEGEFRENSDGPANTGTASAPRTIKNVVVMAEAGKSAAKPSGIMERNTTRRVSPQERKAREREDALEMQRRLRRLRSDDSLRSVDTAIFDPLPTPPAVDNVSGSDDQSGDASKPRNKLQDSFSSAKDNQSGRYSSPVNASLLAEALENISVEENSLMEVSPAT